MITYCPGTPSAPGFGGPPPPISSPSEIRHKFQGYYQWLIIVKHLRFWTLMGIDIGMEMHLLLSNKMLTYLRVSILKSFNRVVRDVMVHKGGWRYEAFGTGHHARHRSTLRWGVAERRAWPFQRVYWRWRCQGRRCRRARLVGLRSVSRHETDKERTRRSSTTLLSGRTYIFGNGAVHVEFQPWVDGR